MAETSSAVTVDTGVITCVVPTSGSVLVTSIVRDGTTIATDGRLVCLRRDSPDTDTEGSVTQEKFVSDVTAVTVEQTGPVRAVVRIEGTHSSGSRSWLPFTVRLAFYAGSDGVRITHTFVYDSDGTTDFVSGLGVRFTVPVAGELYDRHVRFTTADGGVLREAVRTVTGLRRNPGDDVKAAQVAGTALPDTSTWDSRVATRLDLIPAFGDYSLSQLSADGFRIAKRTQAGCGWIDVNAGTRASGLAYLGSPSGGLAMGMRNFWQLHPTQLDVRGAAGDAPELTVWLWSPQAPAMDMRFYHDGLGMDTYEEQDEGLEITYEDYEPEYATPYGIARTTELVLWAVAATPTADALVKLSEALQLPPQLVATPAHLHGAGVFGAWNPVDRSTEARTEIEDRLQYLFDQHHREIEQRRWYGFWDYGDVMHSYDGDRHVWKYDVGGYAWDNSELSTDLWLWQHFLRTGDGTAFRMAEAMSRHTGEVDVYHLGEMAPWGTRHGVQHWGDSSKQPRISNAGYRRHHYFLTGDERVGDLLHEQVSADLTAQVIDIGRKSRTDAYVPSMGCTTSWGACAMAWLAEWERGGDALARTKLLNGIATIPTLTHGFYSNGEVYDFDTGSFTGDDGTISVGSLDCVFGLMEVNHELVDLTGDEAFEAAWVEYCRLYNAGSTVQKAETGSSWGSLNLQQGYARLTAYAAWRLGDDDLAARAWSELSTGKNGYDSTQTWTSSTVSPPLVLREIEEGSVSANASAQYGLAAIACLALIGDKLGG